MCVTLLYDINSANCNAAAPGVYSAKAAIAADIDTIPAPAAYSAGTASGQRITSDITLDATKTWIDLELDILGNGIVVTWNPTTRKYQTVFTAKVKRAAASATAGDQADFQDHAFDKLVKGQIVLAVKLVDGPGYLLLGTETNTVKAGPASGYNSGLPDTDDPNEYTLEFIWRAHGNFPYTYTGAF